MNRGAWRATVHGVCTELDTTEGTKQQQYSGNQDKRKYELGMTTVLILQEKVIILGTHRKISSSKMPQFL